MSSNVLATAAHFDDAELGCGGTLARHARSGDRVYLYVATHSEFKDMKHRLVRSASQAIAEGRRAAKIIGAELIEGSYQTFQLKYDDSLISGLREIIENKKIDTVYLPWTGDVHQDHRAIARATLTAARHCPRILMYRINYYDSEEQFDARHFVDISKTMPLKIKAIRAHVSEMKRTGEKWLKYIEQDDQNRGIKLGVQHAEAFQIVRYLR